MKPGTHRRQSTSTDAVEVFERQLRTPLATLHQELELVSEKSEQLPPQVVTSLQVMVGAVRRLEAAVDGVAWVDEPSTAAPRLTSVPTSRSAG